MNLLENRISYRMGLKPKENKSKDEKPMRAFGKNLTNVDLARNNNVTMNNNNNKTERFYCQPVRIRSNSLSNTTKPPVQKDIIKEYQQQIIISLVKTDKKKQSDIKKQGQITQKMKAILIDWLIDVHSSFQLTQQTLHLAFKYFEDYSNKHYISKAQLQLVGITCLWISAKFEQIYPPRMNHFVQITADTYSIDEMKNMQGKIIQTLGFNLVKTTCLQILDIVLNSRMSQDFGSLCKYLVELSMQNGIFGQYRASIIAFGAIQLAESILKDKNGNNNMKRMRQIFEVDNDQTKLVFKEMCGYLQGVNNKRDNLTAIKRKYMNQKNHQVSKICFQFKG